VPEYEYGRIRKLDENLRKARADEHLIDEIMAGGEEILRGTSPKKKADWFRRSMACMDEVLDADTRRSIRENCACCLGGKRLKVSKSIAKEFDTLEERLAAANQATFVFGHSVTMQDDGTVRVDFGPSGLESYRCVCLPKAEEPISLTYCQCCGGHVKHHLQTALARKVECTVLSSALSSAGSERCSFQFTLLPQQGVWVQRPRSCCATPLRR